MNKYELMRDAVREARITLNAADSVADGLADTLVGRLRRCRPYVLKKLKKELCSFNSHTGRWNDE